MKTTKDLVKAIMEFSTAKGVTCTKERAKFNAAMLARKYKPDICIKAIGDLFYDIDKFPDASYIVKKIRETYSLNVNEKQAATEEANNIIRSIAEHGFNPTHVKKEIGEELFNLIGGGSTVVNYGNGRIELGILRAQIRDAVVDVATRKKKQNNRGKLADINNGLIEAPKDQARLKQ